ncbi:MAG: redoxin family protein [Acidimicrobiia bacterium]
MIPTKKLLVLPALAALALGALVATPAAAQDAKIEVSPKAKVKGAKLPASDAVGSASDPAIGKTAPELVAKGFDGKRVTIGGPGVPRIIVFLSHSCPHCQTEVPVIVELADEGAFEGVDVETVTTNTSKRLPNYPPSEWLEREDWPFPTVLLDDAKLRAFFAAGGEAFPYFVFLDDAGVVVARAQGELSKASIRDATEKLAAGEPIFRTT